jgi:hypothetical protein
MVTTPQTSAEPTARSPAAKRMREYRERRKSGIRCLTVQILPAEIEVLVRRGFLTHETRNDPYDITAAIYRFLDATLV